MERAIWIHTDIPTELVDSATKELKTKEGLMEKSKASGADNVRSSKQLWVPSFVWIGGFIKHYADLANTAFGYDLDGIHGEALQYTVYNEGDYFDWHYDDPRIDGNHNIRKLSFTLQLTEQDEYEGGDLEFDDLGEDFSAPRQRGTIIFFDSRLKHRVTKVTSGTRRALVGWIGGPPWK